MRVIPSPQRAASQRLSRRRCRYGFRHRRTLGLARYARRRSVRWYNRWCRRRRRCCCRHHIAPHRCAKYHRRSVRFGTNSCNRRRRFHCCHRSPPRRRCDRCRSARIDTWVSSRPPVGRCHHRILQSLLVQGRSRRCTPSPQRANAQLFRQASSSSALPSSQRSRSTQTIPSPQRAGAQVLTHASVSSSLPSSQISPS